MNILFDFTTTQNRISGAAEYTLTVFESMYEHLMKNGESFDLSCVFDYSQPMVYDHYSPEKLQRRDNIHVIDIQKKTIANIVNEKSIDIFFIGTGQRYPDLLFKELNCKVFLVIHDVVFGEMRDSKLKDIFLLYNKKRLLRHYFLSPLKNRLLCKNNQINFFEERMANHIKESENVNVITVSGFSKNAINMFYGIHEERIKVFWSPEKLSERNEYIENQSLNQIIQSGKNYLLMLSVGRELKNLSRVLKALSRYNEDNDNPLFLLTTGTRKSFFDWHIAIESLSDSDLENAYKNCYALMYASLHEGFGYPPLEAMKYGKPVLSSNICSLPEVLGEAPVYFSPFYVSDILYAVKRLKNNYQYYTNKSFERYGFVSQKQKEDLNALVHFVLNK